MILVAPDKFKGTFTAHEVAAAIGEGIVQAGGEAHLLPLSDGGDGTMEVFESVIAGARHKVETVDALGRATIAQWLLLDDGRAVVEIAAICGFATLADDELDPLRASSAGVGMVFADIAAHAPREIIIAPGGSAFVDGGRGALEYYTPDTSIPLTVLADTHAHWEQAATMFARQKGATPGQVTALVGRLLKQAEILPRSPIDIPMTGAGGGLAGALWAYGATLLSGSEAILSISKFDEYMQQAQWVITGEGRIDTTSLRGKLVGAIATHARQAGVVCHAVVGENKLNLFEQRLLDIESITETPTLDSLRAAGSALAG